MPFKIPYLVTVILFLTILFYSCNKDGSSDDLLSLELKVIFNPSTGNYECSWTEANISIFEKYYLVYSTTPIPENYDPSQGSMPTKIINDSSQPNFIIEPTIRSYKTYFQVYLDIGDRFIISEMVEFIDETWQSIDIVPNRVIHFPEKNAIYLFEYSTYRLVYYDYVEKEIIKETILDFAFDEAKTGNNGLGDELYFIHDDHFLSIVDANTLEEKQTVTFNELIFSMDTNNKGLLVVSTEYNPAPIKILQRSDLSVINTIDYYSVHTMRRGIAFLSKDDNKFVETGRDYVNLFELSETGELISQASSENPFHSSPINTGVKVSPSGNYFVNTSDGEIFDADLNPIGKLSNSLEMEFSNFYFPSNESTIYAIRKDSYLTNKYNFPSLNPDGHYGLYQFNPILFFYINNELMMVTKDCNKFETVIQPYYF